MGLLCSIFGVLLVAGVWACVVERRLRRERAAWDAALRRGHVSAKCSRCGYDLTRLPRHRCPECGAVLPVVGVRW